MRPRGGEELAIQFSKLATTTLSSSDAHPKLSIQLFSSNAYAPSAPAARESFDATHLTSSSVKSRGAILGMSPYSSKAAQAGLSIGGHACTAASPGDLCNRSPGFGALVVQEETPSPLPVGGLIDSLQKLTRQHCVVVTPGHSFVLLLVAGGIPALSGGPFWLGVPQPDLRAYPSPRGSCAA